MTTQNNKTRILCQLPKENTEMEHQHHPEMPAKMATTDHSKMNHNTMQS